LTSLNGKLSQAERERHARQMLDLVGLAHCSDRFPHQLSGGEQQRVALARALAPKPSVVLLDEPFSNLDAALRRAMREEVRQILRVANATAIFVTHDQEEALSLADTVVIMREGKIEQVGAPQEVYLRPVNREVAAFLGEANFIEGRRARRGGAVRAWQVAVGSADARQGFADDPP
jgi:iron(III) transport system ATP-binding protein